MAKAKLSTIETIERFVLRARRIQNHSLVQHWDALIQHAEGSMTTRVTLSGQVTVIQQLPPEELFESLAARVRPLTLSSEPIHHSKVVGALSDLLQHSDKSRREHRETLDALLGSWRLMDIQGPTPIGYSVQSARLDGSAATNLVSDIQLAAAWLYADLVHADAQGKKSEALAFTLRERYAAGVRIFARVAVLSCQTLEFITQLEDAGILTLSRAAWDDSIAVGVEELAEESEAFIAAPGTEAPDLRSPDIGVSDEWTPMTVTSMLRLNVRDQVQVELTNATGDILASYDAAVIHRGKTDEQQEWTVLVGGSHIFPFRFTPSDQKVRVSLDPVTILESSNRLKLAAVGLSLRQHHATQMHFSVAGTRIISTDCAPFEAERLRYLEVMHEVLDDIVTVERLTGRQLNACDKEFSDVHRIRLRQARLIHQGHIVQMGLTDLHALTLDGHPPLLVALEAGSLVIGGTEVPVPATCMSHPLMIASQGVLAPERGPEARRFTLSVPTGQRFLGWSPERHPEMTRESLVATAPWGLSGIDEASFGL